MCEFAAKFMFEGLLYVRYRLPVSHVGAVVGRSRTTMINHEVTLGGELTCYITYGLRLHMVNAFLFSYIKFSRRWPPSTSWSAKSHHFQKYPSKRSTSMTMMSLWCNPKVLRYVGVRNSSMQWQLYSQHTTFSISNSRPNSARRSDLSARNSWA